MPEDPSIPVIPLQDEIVIPYLAVFRQLLGSPVLPVVDVGRYVRRRFNQPPGSRWQRYYINYEGGAPKDNNALKKYKLFTADQRYMVVSGIDGVTDGSDEDVAVTTWERQLYVARQGTVASWATLDIVGTLGSADTSVRRFSAILEKGDVVYAIVSASTSTFRVRLLLQYLPCDEYFQDHVAPDSHNPARLAAAGVVPADGVNGAVLMYDSYEGYKNSVAIP